MDTPKNKSNLIAQKFWAHTKEIWASLSIGGKQKWFAVALELTRNAWADATAGTDLPCPLKYEDFAFKGMPYDMDGDGKLDTPVYYSSKQYYGFLPHHCKPTWDAVAVKQICEQLKDLYQLRDTGVFPS